MSNFKETMQQIVQPAIGPVMDMVSGIALDGLAGTLVPGAGNLILAYKQQRTEKNLEIFISKIVERQDEFNEKLNKLDLDKLDLITKHYFGVVTDYVLDVKQKEKIKYIVDGYIHLADFEELKEDVVLMYYDTLEELNIIDIAVLKSHTYEYIHDEENNKILDSLLPGQRRMISEKLYRMGLFDSENSQKMDDNLKNIVQYLQDMEKGKKNPKLNVKKVWGSDSYKLTSYGRSFLEFFLEEYRE
ncbi:MAG: hypothetical protein KH020_07165 [Clostridiales bacterium]|nr:hypothetical protein [Clostridiales bacterium]